MNLELRSLYKIAPLFLIASLLLGSAMVLGACNKVDKDVAELSELMHGEGETSLQLIDSGLAAGELDEETALLYKMYAVFGDDALPEQYRSDKKFRNSDDVVAEARLKMDTLSAGTKEKLAPFFKRPDDPESYFNIRYGQEEPAESSFIPNAFATRGDPNIYTDFFTSADGKAKIWYPNRNVAAPPYGGGANVIYSSDNGKKIAEQIKGFLDNDNILQEFKDLMQRSLVSDGSRGGDSKFDIYVAPAGGDLGLTYCEGAKPCSAYLIININIGTNRKKVLRTTLAHEIFHAYQYAYKYAEPKDDWWSEATAVWAEDYIYPGDNTEQDWLSNFIPYPDTTFYEQSPPSEHHYGAYIFPYFYSENYGDDYMRKSWEGCESGDCIKAVDQAIDGGYKKQWKEFTMWNYNKDPAKKYTDINGFKTLSSGDRNTGQTLIIGDSVQEIDVELLEPLTAYLTDAINIANHEEVQKLTFKEIDSFTGLSDKAAIKALIYYEDGRKEIEDWTDKKERSFCIASKDERFAHIMLIFSNADMEEVIPPIDIKVEGKDNCFEINQEDDRTAVIHFPYSNRGASGTVDINTTIETNTIGEPEEPALEGQEYAYLTKWKIKNEFEQIRGPFSVPCDGSVASYDAGWTTRAAGYLLFDLGPEGLSEDGTFSVDLEHGLPHPKGTYEVVPTLNIHCIGITVGASNIDLSGVKFTMEGIWQGRIFDMTEDGAKIEIMDSCLYDDCYTQYGALFQTINEPVILEIKRANK